jgi:hypothetical protein
MVAPVAPDRHEADLVQADLGARPIVRDESIFV